MPRSLLITGAPNSRKTTSLMGWRKAARPGVVHIVTCPREEGWETIPPTEPGLKHHLIEVTYNADGTPVDWSAIVSRVRVVVSEILAGKHGPANTIAIDGFHKYIEALLGSLTSGKNFAGESFNGMLIYPKLQTRAAELIHLLKSSTVNYVVFTSWDGYEKDRDTDEDSMEGGRIVKAPRHKWPDLPGKLAKQVLGLINTVHATCDGTVARWQTRPAGDVQGCGLKRPPAICEKIPLYVPQDWPNLEKLMYPEGYA